MLHEFPLYVNTFFEKSKKLLKNCILIVRALFFCYSSVGVDVVILFAVPLNDPQAREALFSYLRRARPAARMFSSTSRNFLFVGQSSLRSDSRSTAKSITTSALSDVRIKRHFRSDKQQVHRCFCHRITSS